MKENTESKKGFRWTFNSLTLSQSAYSNIDTLSKKCIPIKKKQPVQIDEYEQRKWQEQLEKDRQATKEFFAEFDK